MDEIITSKHLFQGCNADNRLNFHTAEMKDKVINCSDCVQISENFIQFKFQLDNHSSVLDDTIIPEVLDHKALVAVDPQHDRTGQPKKSILISFNLNCK